MSSDSQTPPVAWSVASRDVLLPLIAYLDRVRIPKFIYHYTTPQGFLGILESKSIWATRIRHLNDRSETGYSGALLDRAFNEFEIELTESQRAGFKLLRQVLEMYGLRAGKFRGDTYIAAFSEKSDHLSQWERYSGPHGYAIGFGVTETLLPPTGPILNMFPIEYRREVQLQILKDILKIGFDALLEVEEEQRTIENLTQWANSYANVLIAASHHFKHPSFVEEGEWRVARERAAKVSATSNFELDNMESFLTSPWIFHRTPISLLRRSSSLQPTTSMKRREPLS